MFCYINVMMILVLEKGLVFLLVIYWVLVEYFSVGGSSIKVEAAGSIVVVGLFCMMYMKDGVYVVNMIFVYFGVK